MRRTLNGMVPFVFGRGCAVFQLFLAVSAVNAGVNPDSLEYQRVRDSIVKSAENQPLLETAGALAREGFYTEAAALIRDFLPAERADRDAAVFSVPRLKSRWHFSCGTDYYHIDDVDTAVMTSEELRDYNRLIETPLSLWSRARLDRDHYGQGRRWNLRPAFYVSERKGSVEVPVRLHLGRDRVAMEGSVGAAKWFRADASNTVPFEPLRAQPSDMGEGSFRITGRSAPAAERSLRWTVPASLEWEHYRKNRTGYESFVEYGLSPSLEWRRSGAPVGLRALVDCRCEDYYNDGADSLDVVRLMGRADVDLRYGRTKVTPSLALHDDRYLAHDRLRDVGRVDAVLRAEHSCGGRLYCRYVYEQEKSRIESGAPPLLDGDETTVRPSVKITVLQCLVMEPECSAEIRRSVVRRGKDSLTRRLWEARRSWEPGIRCVFNRGTVDASLRCSFRFDDRFDATDSRVYRLGVETTAAPFDRFAFNLFADYQYRVYAPYGAYSRRAENASVSANVAVKL